MATPVKKDDLDEIAPIDFAKRSIDRQPAEPEIVFEDLSADAKLAMLESLKASLKSAKEGEHGDHDDISPLMANIEALILGKTDRDPAEDVFGNKLDLARANLRDQMNHIDPEMYPACDDRMTVKLPRSAKKHLVKKAIDQDMTLSEYVIQALNIVGELEGDDKLVLVAPRGHFLQQASRDRAKRS